MGQVMGMRNAPQISMAVSSLASVGMAAISATGLLFNRAAFLIGLPAVADDSQNLALLLAQTAAAIPWWVFAIMLAGSLFSLFQSHYKVFKVLDDYKSQGSRIDKIENDRSDSKIALGNRLQESEFLGNISSGLLFSRVYALPQATSRLEWWKKHENQMTDCARSATDSYSLAWSQMRHHMRMIDFDNFDRALSHVTGIPLPDGTIIENLGADEGQNGLIPEAEYREGMSFCKNRITFYTTAKSRLADYEHQISRGLFEAPYSQRLPSIGPRKPQ